MTKLRAILSAAFIAAFAFLLVLPVHAQCDPDTDPSCRLSPLQSRQVNPAAQESEGTAIELEDSGVPETVQSSELPLVTASSISLSSSTAGSSELRVQSPELGAQNSAPGADSSATEAPSFSSLELRMRYQDPSDVSCGVQALGMALAGLRAEGLAAPSSSALLGFLQGQDMMYDFGTGVEELAYAAGSFGFKGTQPFHGWTLADLRAELVEGRPVVVALGSNGEGVPGHFVTVTGLSEDGQWISYNDPTLGKVTKSIDDFNALWAAQGNSGVSVRSPSSLPAAAPDNLPLLALMAGIMALVSATPMGKMRQGVGGKIVQAGNGANPNAPPHPAPAGQRWRAKTVPVYETKTVQDGWTNVSRQVPIKEMVREQVGTRTYYEKIPKFKTISVRDGYKWVKRSVPKYKTVSYVRGYRYRTTRVPSWRGWRYVRRRVPIYGSKRVRAGSKTVWRQVPKYATKEVPDGYHTIERTKPVYALKEKIVGYKTVEKRIPRMVDKREQVGTKTEWELEDVPEDASNIIGNSNGDVPVRPLIISQATWHKLTSEEREILAASILGSYFKSGEIPIGLSGLNWDSLINHFGGQVSEDLELLGISDEAWQNLSAEEQDAILATANLFSSLSAYSSEERISFSSTFIGDNPYSIDSSYGPDAGIANAALWILEFLGLAYGQLGIWEYGNYLNSQPHNVSGQLSYRESNNGINLRSIEFANHSESPIKAAITIETSSGQVFALTPQWINPGSTQIEIPATAIDDPGNLQFGETANVNVTLVAGYNEPDIIRFLSFEVQPTSQSGDDNE